MGVLSSIQNFITKILSTPHWYQYADMKKKQKSYHASTKPVLRYNILAVEMRLRSWLTFPHAI